MIKTPNFIHQSKQTVMKIVKLLSLIICIGITLTSCSKNGGNTTVITPAPAMNAHYFMPAYTTDATAPNAKNNTSIATAMPDAVYYTNGYTAAGVVFTFKDQTGAVLTTLTGVPQSTTVPTSQYTVVNMPAFTIPAAWLGKVVTITASNSTAFTKYRIN